ncbi:hypothetical protein CDLVIII_3982 [Clostridium sp. DL-VIII]|nr:hypothetical protein [Clostridium sp. DL-VIII]EHJ00521.1 hypothetical protein CDLVIII_3982 [Clostridium sp. DL-VIII]
MNKTTSGKKFMEIIKGLPEEQQEVILYLSEIFEGEEEAVLEYCRKEFVD